jgi:hypothetical protein
MTAIACARLSSPINFKRTHYDAAHFVAAMETRCDVFLTGDNRIRSSHGIKALAVESI